MPMGKTRAIIRDREDFSELMKALKIEDIEYPPKEKIPQRKIEIVTNESNKDYQRMLSDERNLYIYEKSRNRIHDKHCICLKHLPIDDLVGIPEYMTDVKQCKTCEIESYLRIGAEDYKKHLKYEELLYEIMEATPKLLRKLYVDMRCTTRLCDANAIRIQHDDEVWKIKAINKHGHVSLSHNDYCLSYNGTRKRYHTFHIQNDSCKRTSIKNAIMVIQNYKKHRPYCEYTRREQQVIRLLKANPYETQANMADMLGVSVSTIRRTMQSLKNSETIKRNGKKRGGYWKVTM